MKNQILAIIYINVQIFSINTMEESGSEKERKIKNPEKKGKAKRAIRAVAEYLRCPETELTAEREGLGYSNIVFKVSKGEKRYLYKEYLDHAKTETAELKWQKYFECPNILFECSRYRIDEYINHTVLSKKTLKTPTVLKNIAKELGRMHRLEPPAGMNRAYMEILKEQRSHLVGIIGNRRFFEICKKIERKIEYLYEESIFRTGLSLCHNDLQFGNILLLPSNTAVLIDFEHVSMNIPTVDIAGFFNEASTNYRVRGAPVSKRHFSCTKYAVIFLNAYLKERDISVPIERVAKEIEKVRPVANYYWFIWAVNMLGKENIQKSLDYFSFAMYRLNYLQRDGFITETNVKEMKSFVKNRR